MKNNIIAITVWAVVVGVIFYFGYTIGNTKGWSKGWADANELDKKLECQYEWGNKPNTEVPVKCLKYLQQE
jgi:hypothetical protein